MSKTNGFFKRACLASLLCLAIACPTFAKEEQTTTDVKGALKFIQDGFDERFKEELGKLLPDPDDAVKVNSVQSKAGEVLKGVLAESKFEWQFGDLRTIFLAIETFILLGIIIYYFLSGSSDDEEES